MYNIISNTCTRSWFTELKQSTLVVQIKGPARDSVWTPEFDIKNLKKAEGHIDRNVMIITIKKMPIRIRIPNILHC